MFCITSWHESLTEPDVSVFPLQTKLACLTFLPSTAEVLADSPLQCFPNLSLCYVRCLESIPSVRCSCRGTRERTDLSGTPKARALHQQGEQHDKSFGLGAKTCGVSYGFFFFVWSDSEICQAAVSGFIFLHLQNRATTAQPSERMQGNRSTLLSSEPTGPPDDSLWQRQLCS